MASNPEEKKLESGDTDQSKVAVPEVVVEKIAEGSIDGQVSCTEGPVRNATVSFGVVETFTDNKGYFLLEHVSPGIGKIRVKPTSTRFYDSTTDVLVEADKRKNIFIFLTEVTGRVEGIVTDENGKPLVGAEVWSLFRLGKPAISTKTDENGHYLFEDILRGSYYVRAKADGHMIEGVTINVTGGSTAVTNFKLASGALSVSGHVVSKKDGKGIDCLVYLMRKGIVVTTTQTTVSGEGKFAFENLTPDIYEISTVAAGYQARGWRAEVQKSEVVNFELEEAPLHQRPERGH